MSSTGVFSLCSPATFHHRWERPQIFTPTQFLNPKGIPFRWRNSRVFSPKLSQFFFALFTFPGIYSLRLLFLQRISSILWRKKAAISLVGSFVFLGFCSSKPALALPPATIVSLAELEDEELFEKLLESEPKNMEAMKAVLHKKMRRGKTEDVVKYVKKLMKLEPDEVEWKLLEALCYETMGEWRLYKNILNEQPLLIRSSKDISIDG